MSCMQFSLGFLLAVSAFFHWTAGFAFECRICRLLPIFEKSDCESAFDVDRPRVSNNSDLLLWL